MTPNEFEEWFEKPVQMMLDYEHGGFAALMLVLPLAERFFREKSGANEDNTLPAAFFNEFNQVFRNLDEQKARDFWKCFRHGFLHQATFQTAPRLGISYNVKVTAPCAAYPHEINHDSLVSEITVIPETFCRKVLDTIKADFSTFEAIGSPNHRMPVITPAVYAYITKPDPLTGAPVQHQIMLTPSGSGNPP